MSGIPNIITTHGGGLLSKSDHALWVRPYPNPLGLPAFTARILFERVGYDPVADGGWKRGAHWRQVSTDPNIWDYTRESANWSSEFQQSSPLPSSGRPVFPVLGANTTGVTNMSGMFRSTLLYSTVYFDTSAVTDMSYMFAYDGSASHSDPSRFTWCPNFDTHNVTNMRGMFMYSDLRAMPDLDTHNVTNMREMFAKAFLFSDRCLTKIRLYDTSSVQDVRNMFQNQRYVAGGALAFYNQLANQQTPPSQHSYCFFRTGDQTTVGQEELAQIPDDWKQ